MTAIRKRSARPPLPVAVEVIVEAGAWPLARRLRGLAERAIGAAASRLARKIGDNAELTVVFTDNGRVRRLNRRFRGKDKATNVLSFPAGPTGSLGPLLGDIVLGHETVKAEADDQGLTLNDHLTHLIVHGFLHLCGYDHGVEAEALAMERLETAILADLGIADPYGDRSPLETGNDESG